MAQILEHDIATQARKYEDLFRDIRRVVMVHLAVAEERGTEPFMKIPPAPKRYWRLFEEGAPLNAREGTAPSLDATPDLDLHSALLDLSQSERAPAAFN